MCKDVSASEQQLEQKRLLDGEDASSPAGSTHTIWHIGGNIMACGKKAKKKATKKKAKKKKKK
ncbi:MAG: hypothetical protein JW880_06350 [Candidatus Thermoplasmatota archaeon]|nr:hypothetical protein [Candidatus Thermoplasmatota archaeon]